ncbi:MAG: phage tail protein [Sphingobium sp.]
MATLVLTVVGTVLGGPIGGAIGATLGQAIDSQVLFAPKARQGPRLSDLRLQTSSYGSQIPKLFGRMRVAGTVIWATDLQEQRHHQHGGKGQPSTNTYTYSASFAVALSARQIGSIGRIWADGNLLRGSAGDFKSAIGAFRVALGSEDQGVDPLVGAALGSGLASAHRGMAYAVFENLELADFGNRIPSLTFEAIADAAPVALGTIASELSGGDISGIVNGATPLINGYAASGQNVGDALSPLVDGLGLAVRSDGMSLSLQADGAAEGTVDSAILLRSANGRAVTPRHQSRERADQVPVRLTLRHYDAARDYQAGVQTATRPGPGRRDISVDLPATLDAAVVRSLAEERLHALWTARSSLELRASWGALTLAPGATITLPDHPGLWRIEERAWEDMNVRLQLRQLGVGASVIPSIASSGTSLSQPDVPHGPTSVMLAELSGLGDVAESAPVMVVACVGASSGWRHATLYSENDADGSLTLIGASAPAATMGSVLTPPTGASPQLFDETPMLVVQLLADVMTLSNADDAALAQGANLCLVGDELIQFGRAIPTGSRTFRLEHLLRGRRGTEWAMATHIAGEGFLLLESDRLFQVSSSNVHMGSNLHINAIGIGDATPAEAQHVVEGQAILPLAPVHFVVQAASGGWDVTWTRRSRVGWRWIDGADAPLGEERELYHIEWADGGGVFRNAEVGVPSFAYSAAMVAADHAAGHAGSVTVTVRQIGTYGPGRTAALTLIL